MINDERRSRRGAAPNVVSATNASVPPMPPVVIGWAYGPCAGRSQYSLVVELCDHCGLTHFHRAPVLHPLLTRYCPRYGRQYLIAPRVVRDVRRKRRAEMAHVRRR